MKYANWKKGEPNGGSNENCVILLGNAYYGRWNDMSCDYSVQFLFNLLFKDVTLKTM